MTIAWTYLLHAYYRKKGIEYRYYDQLPKRRRYQRIGKKAYKHWELGRCLDETASPIDRDTANNLRFLIGLRNEIEHQMTLRLDDYLSARYQACVLNYNHYLKLLFGPELGIDKNLSFSLQFADQSPELSRRSTKHRIPERLNYYIAEFDTALTSDEYNSERYSYRLLFTKKLTSRAGQADKVVEFNDPNSEIGQTIETEYWAIKEVERPKYLPSQIVEAMHEAGFSRFEMHHHTNLWKTTDAKVSGKGYGHKVGNTWYWYERWKNKVEQYCNENESIFR